MFVILIFFFSSFAQRDILHEIFRKWYCGCAGQGSLMGSAGQGSLMGSVGQGSLMGCAGQGSLMGCAGRAP
jgi:hypothetical protein